MSTSNPIAAAYDRALSRCGQAALAVEEAERVLQERYKAFDQAHVELNMAHAAMEAAELFDPHRVKLGLQGTGLTPTEPRHLRRKRHEGRIWDRRLDRADDEDETTD